MQRFSGEQHLAPHLAIRYPASTPPVAELYEPPAFHPRSEHHHHVGHVGVAPLNGLPGLLASEDHSAPGGFALAVGYGLCSRSRRVAHTQEKREAEPRRDSAASWVLGPAAQSGTVSGLNGASDGRGIQAPSGSRQWRPLMSGTAHERVSRDVPTSRPTEEIHNAFNNCDSRAPNEDPELEVRTCEARTCHVRAPDVGGDGIGREHFEVRPRSVIA